MIIDLDFNRIFMSCFKLRSIAKIIMFQFVERAVEFVSYGVEVVYQAAA